MNISNPVQDKDARGAIGITYEGDRSEKKEDSALKEHSVVGHDTVQTSPNNPEYNLAAQLRFLVAFIDEHLSSHLSNFRTARAGTLRSIEFEDLWTLFTPGDVIYTPYRQAPEPNPTPTAEARSLENPNEPAGGQLQYSIAIDTQRTPKTKRARVNTSASRYAPQAFRVVAVAGGIPNHGIVHPLDRPLGQSSFYFLPLIVHCYYIDFTGSRFECVADTFTFRPFDGSVEVTSLEAYPLAYAGPRDIEGDGIKRVQPTITSALLEERGYRFLEVCKVSHKLYEGLTVGPKVEEVTSRRGPSNSHDNTYDTDDCR